MKEYWDWIRLAYDPKTCEIVAAAIITCAIGGFAVAKRKLLEGKPYMPKHNWLCWVQRNKWRNK